jgi:AraC family transcriptional regulator
VPFQRRLVLQTPLVQWSEVTPVEAGCGWSDAYRVATPRLLLPLAATFWCRLGGLPFACDALCALWLTPESDYRLRLPSAAMRSAVVSISVAPELPTRCIALSPRQRLRLRAWARSARDTGVDALAIEETLLDWLASLDSAPAPRCHRAVERAREFLAEDPGAAHSLDDIARAAACSPFHLARQFRRHTGATLHQHRTRLRMALAVDRLADGERDLSALAQALGYTSHSHFSAVFRRTFGAAPRQVRRNLTAPAAH